MPVRIRKADVHTAMFSVDATAAQRLVDYSGLQVCQHRPGRAVVNLMLVRYIDGDLGQYHEFGTAVMVNPPGSDARGLRALGDAAAFIHHLPVDQSFTLEAGRTIWGFPKIMADFTVHDAARRIRISMSEPTDSTSPASTSAAGCRCPRYSRRDRKCSRPTPTPRGLPARCRGRCGCSGVRGRIGGATLRLGDHPTARSWRRWACRGAPWCRVRSAMCR